MDEEGLIGADGALPWHLPDDLKHFKALTVGHPVLMGRRTYESIGRPLPKRRNLVLTRSAGQTFPGCECYDSLAAALRATAQEEEVHVIGGSSIYALALPRVEVLHLTRVHGRFSGDVHFPALDWTQWQLESDERHEADDRHACAFSFRCYRRR